MTTLEDLAAKSWFELWGLASGMLLPTIGVLRVLTAMAMKLGR
jgi:hypothetical protein